MKSLNAGTLTGALQCKLRAISYSRYKSDMNCFLELCGFCLAKQRLFQTHGALLEVHSVALKHQLVI